MKVTILTILLISLSSNLWAGNVFTVKEGKTYLNDEEFLVIGLRCSNALISDESVNELIDQLDLYQLYGINTISVFFMGSRFGDVKGYKEDASLNTLYTKRMEKIIRECDKLDMVVLVGCLYWGGSKAKWESWKQEDAENAVANTVQWLSDNNFRNVFVDPDNEGMAQRNAGFKIQGMIEAGKRVDPTIMIGYNAKGKPSKNADLALHFSDRHEGMPYIESEGTMTDYWGAYSKEKNLYEYINVGIYTEGKKAEQLIRTGEHLRNGEGYMFASTWLQNVPPNYQPGGDGSPCNPGFQWWLNFILDNF